MTLSELGLKLLPYTYIEEGQVQFATTWSQLSDGDKIITSIEIVLLFIFFAAFLKLLQSWFVDKRQINILSKVLKKYEDKDISIEYNNLLSDIDKSHKNLKNIWNQFDKSLIKKRTIDGNFLILNSIDSEYFFNKSTMVKHVGSKLFSSIPGILLGIGLLGTFFGLYVALIQLNVDDASKLSESIKILINMAGVKFAASIWGLFLSILFTFMEKGLEFNLDNKLERIQKKINELFKSETAEQNLDKILIENEQQTKALNGLATSLTEKIASEFNNILIPKIDSMNDHFSNLPNNISSSISDSLEKPLQNISDTVKNITTNQAEQSTQALETLIEKFIEKIDSVAGNQGEMLKESTIQSQKVLEETSNHLNTTFNSMNEMMLDQNNISQERDKKILEDLNSIKDSQTQMLDELSTNVNNNISEINDNVSANIQKLVSTISNVTEQQSINSSDREEKIFIKINELVNGIDVTKEHLESLISNFKKEVINIDNIFSQTSQKLSFIPNQIDKFSTSINKLSDFENSQKETVQQFQEFNNKLSTTTQNISIVIEQLKTSVTEFNTTNSNFGDTIINTKELLSHMNNDFSTLSEKNNVIVDNFSKNVDRSLNEYHKTVEDAIKSRIVPQLDQTLSEYASKMAEAINALSESIDELRDEK